MWIFVDSSNFGQVEVLQCQMLSLFLFSPFVWRQVWQYLETVVTFLLGMAKYLEKELKRKPINDVHVQEVLMNKLRPFGIPNADIGGKYINFNELLFSLY